MPKPWISCVFVASLVFPAVVAAQMGGPIEFGSPMSNDRWMRDQAIYRRQAEIEKTLQNLGRAPAPAPVVEEPVEELAAEDDPEMEDESEELADDESDESDESDDAATDDEDDSDALADDSDEDSDDDADADSEDFGEDDE